MIVVIMGVTGVGKTTVGELLAAECGMRFYDADDYHPPANVEKMRAGVALRDEDRWPWLERLNRLLAEAVQRGESAVLACSALKQSYRERLAAGLPELRFVWLHGDKQLIYDRLAARKGHYMNPTLLDSQLATLEEPAGAIAIDIDRESQLIVKAIRDALGC